MEEIVKRLLENHQLNEMAMEQSKAISHCQSLGRRFLEHFHKVYVEGTQGQGFKHHCQEMQSWYDDVKSIRLKSNNKNISKVHLIDWFFTAGAGVEDYLHEESEIDMYEEFIIHILSSEDKVEDILRNQLKGI